MIPACARCIRLMRETKDGRACCLAYPDGIPPDILSGERVHIEVQPDQRGEYVFKDINSLFEDGARLR